MKVVLATASYTTFFTFHRRFLSLAYIHAYAVKDALVSRRCSIAHDYFDVHLEEPDSIAQRIADAAPDVLGFSCYSWNTVEILDLVRRIRARVPECRIVLGGPEVGSHHRRVLEEHPGIDVIVVGEGEEAFTELLHVWLGEGEIDQVAGIAYRDGQGIRQTAPRPYLTDLDRLPSPWLEGVFEPDELMGGAYWQTVRGCPFLCSYCDYGRNQPYYEFSPERVEQELEYFRNSGVRAIFNIDPTFNFRRERANGILELAAEKELDALLWLEIFPSLIDEGFIERLGKLRRAFVGIGLQTLNRNTMRQITRFWVPEKNIERIEAIARLPNTYLSLELVLGLPGDTLEDFKETLDWAYARRPNEVFAQPLSLLPRTPLEAQAAELGIRAAGMECGHDVIATAECSEQDIALGKAMLNWHRLFQAIFFRLAHVLDERPSSLLEQWSVRSYYNGIYDLVDKIHCNRITPEIFDHLEVAFRDFVTDRFRDKSLEEEVEAFVGFIRYIYVRRAFTEDRAFVLDILDINGFAPEDSDHRILSACEEELEPTESIAWETIPSTTPDLRYETYPADPRKLWKPIRAKDLRGLECQQTTIAIFTEPRCGAGRAVIVDEKARRFLESVDGERDLSSLSAEMGPDSDPRPLFALLQQAGILRSSQVETCDSRTARDMLANARDAFPGDGH